MDKKDIYEHLAQIYLDASKKGTRRSKPVRIIKYPVASSIIVALSVFLITVLALRFHRKPFHNSEIALVLNNEVVKINYNFDPAKKEVYAIELNKLNLGRFRELGFSLRKKHTDGTVTMRVEFVNSFDERSEVYLRDIPQKWQSVRLPLSAFKKISDWSQMRSLLLIVEDWNTSSKNGVVYVDNISFLK